MSNDLKRYSLPLLLAVVVHLAVASVFVLSLEWTEKPQLPQPKVDVVKAVAVDEKAIQAEVNKLQKEKARREAEEEARRRKAEEESRRLKALESERKQQEQRKTEEERRLVEISKQRAAEQQKAEAEKKKLAAEQQKRQAEVDKLKRQQEEAERKARAETERLAQLERERKLEEDRKRKAEEDRKKREAEAAMRKAMEDEQRVAAAAEEKRAQTVVDEYTLRIKQKIERNWTKPVTARPGMSCTLVVRLIPGGEVVSVQVTGSSGDPLFDRSAEIAVGKASPLPLPPEPALFERFRELRLPFKPEG